MVLTDTGRLGASPFSRGCTSLVLTPSEDVGGITTVVNSLWKSYAIPKCGVQVQKRFCARNISCKNTRSKYHHS